MTIALVGGALANKRGMGGSVWTRLSYAVGLKRLGFDVLFLEQIDRERCTDREDRAAAFEESQQAAFFRECTRDFGLDAGATLLLNGTDRTVGLALSEVRRAVDSARLLLNISGHIDDARLLPRTGLKIFVDQDPGFTQFWLARGEPGVRIAGHDVYFTIGENVGAADCVIPTSGLRWHPTRQPIVLTDWPVAPSDSLERYTTIGSWRGPYGPVVFDGKTYGLKAHEFRRFIELPRHLSARCEIALDIHPADQADMDRLRANGWSLVDPRSAAGDPYAFRSFVQQSDAELSVAQGVYVATGSGWFSGRTARYLASGKPALVQDTGFSRNYPVGEGLVPFRRVEEAIDGAARLSEDYGRHREAARRLAETCFDSDLVLSRLLEDAGLRCSP